MKSPKKPKPRPVGRPPSQGEIGKRYQVYLLPSIAQQLRELGDGSLSVGITQAAGTIRQVAAK
jgi:hypothetical protein